MIKSKMLAEIPRIIKESVCTYFYHDIIFFGLEEKDLNDFIIKKFRKSFVRYIWILRLMVNPEYSFIIEHVKHFEENPKL